MRARIRTVKPEVLMDEELWDLSQETGLPVLQAFVGLWLFADREGRFEWRPRALRSGILPYWDGDFGEILSALEEHGFIRSYTVDGKLYGLVPNFLKHQVINSREEQSKLPAPSKTPVNIEEIQTSETDSDENSSRDDGAHARTCTHVHAQGEGNGRERKGREGNDASPRVTDNAPEPKPTKPKTTSRKSPELPISKSWAPNDQHRSMAIGLLVDVNLAAESFRDHAETHDRRCANWDAAFRSWLKKEKPRKLQAGAFDPIAYAAAERAREQGGGS